ncbi:Hypothetical protein, putative [Bodo saltans]|uniref:Leucine-rich repeat protein n=1 Tax=Bodo saltans TaxID=75058 RepID=A0A0S4JNF8_BODSA|nr:Hypothetical protein, putative [Bodo saltans]|eukprot:CUG91679.1 Hypothetical protein, putative [Bodo saltans]
MEEEPFLDHNSERFSDASQHTEMTDHDFGGGQQQQQQQQSSSRMRSASTTSVRDSGSHKKMTEATEAPRPQSEYEKFEPSGKSAASPQSNANYNHTPAASNPTFNRPPKDEGFCFAFPEPIPDPVSSRSADRDVNAGAPPEAMKPNAALPINAPLPYPAFGVEVLKRDADPKAAMPPPPAIPDTACALPEKELMSFLSNQWNPGHVPSVITDLQTTYFADLPHWIPAATTEVNSADRSRISFQSRDVDASDSEQLSKWQAESMQRMTSEAKNWYAAVKKGTYHVSGSVNSFFSEALDSLTKLFKRIPDRTIPRLFLAVHYLERLRNHFGLWHITNNSLHKYAIEYYVRSALAASQETRKVLREKQIAKRGTMVPGLSGAAPEGNRDATGGTLGTVLMCLVCPCYIMFCGNPFQKITEPLKAVADVFFCTFCFPLYCICGSPFKPGSGPLGGGGGGGAPSPASMMGGLGNLGGLLGSNQEKVEYSEPIASDINVLPKLCEIDIDSVLHHKSFAPNVLRRLQAERMFNTKLRLKFIYMLLSNTKPESSVNLLISAAMPSRVEDFKLQLYKMRQEYDKAQPGQTMRSKALDLRRKLQAQGAQHNELLKTEVGLLEVMEPDAIVMTRHFVFHPQPEAIRAVDGIHNVNTSLLREELRERKIPPQVQRYVDENTREKYIELGRYFHDGHFMELLSVDGAFDGEQFFNVNPFGVSKDSYIAAVDFSVPVASLSPENYAVNPQRGCWEILCGTLPSFKPFVPANIYGFFEAVMVSPKALDKLASINLSGYQFKPRDVHSLCTILRTGKVRHLDLSDCVFMNETLISEHLAPALDRCTKLEMVNFSNMLTGLVYAEARPVNPNLTKLVLAALRNSKMSLEEVWCAGACPRRRRPENMTSGFSTLRTSADERNSDFPSTMSILSEIIQYPNLVSVNFSYQELSAPLVTELIVYITKTSHILFAFFDGTGQTIELEVPQPKECCCCCGGSTKTPSLIGVSPTLLKELTAALSRNQLRQGLGVCFDVVNGMLQRYIMLKREADINVRDSRSHITTEGAKVIDHAKTISETEMNLFIASLQAASTKKNA